MDSNPLLEIRPSERMAYRASLELRDQDIVFVGIGLPNLACNLALALHAPHLMMIYESGAVGALPERLPVSIGDPALVTNSLAIVSQADIFQCFLQKGYIQVGFLGGAQIDPYGCLNTTVIGDYRAPKVRLPGSGGACEIATHAKRLLIVMRLSKKAFVPQCDFVTSPGHRFKGKTRQELGLSTQGPELVITDKGVFNFNDAGHMQLCEIYPGSTLEDIRANCGFEVLLAPQLKEACSPGDNAINLLRKKLDPDNLYL